VPRQYAAQLFRSIKAAHGFSGQFHFWTSSPLKAISPTGPENTGVMLQQCDRGYCESEAERVRHGAEKTSAAGLKVNPNTLLASSI
jgi:hypothetical protein